MSIKSIVAPSGVVFLLAGIYFGVLSSIGETTLYAMIPAIVCIVAFVLGAQPDWIVSNPWRTATTVLVIVLLAVQVGANSTTSARDYFTLASTALNGILLVFFIGVLLSSVKKSVSAPQAPEALSNRKELA